VAAFAATISRDIPTPAQSAGLDCYARLRAQRRDSQGEADGASVRSEAVSISAGVTILWWPPSRPRFHATPQPPRRARGWIVTRAFARNGAIH